MSSPAMASGLAMDMSKLAIIGTTQVVPTRRGEVLAALAAHQARCLRDEPGTLRFEILVPREDDTRILLYEVYQDDAAFELHRNSPSIAQFRKETADLGVTISITRCAPLR
jgi:(4S)-4-hydroxy-5-phosphonooxypentane-2,3-dione isomerase